MVKAENVVKAYRSRKAATNWATWAQEHKHQNDLLNEAEKAYHVRIRK